MNDDKENKNEDDAENNENTNPRWPYPQPDDSYTADRWAELKYGFSVRFSPAKGQPKLVRYTPRPDDPGWIRAEARWTGSQWEPVGSEIVYTPAFDGSLPNGGGITDQ